MLNSMQKMWMWVKNVKLYRQRWVKNVKLYRQRWVKNIKLYAMDVDVDEEC